MCTAARIPAQPAHGDTGQSDSRFAVDTGGSMFLSGNELHFIHGDIGDSDKLNLDTDAWTDLADAPFGIYDEEATAVDDNGNAYPHAYE